MATTHLTPVSEYLNTAHRPDVDYVDGEIKGRNSGERDHSDIQTFLATFLNTRQQSWSLKLQTELRVQIRPDRFRVPDLCILSATAPREGVVRTPPLVCIEILSPADTVARMRERIRDFFDMGVLEVWLVDPPSRTVLVCAGATMTEMTEGALTLEGTPINIPIPDIFTLDEA